MAFALKEAVDVYAHQISEVAMDSTCKSQGQCVINRNLPADPGQTNSAGQELYGLIGEANGQALPLGIIFAAITNSNARKGAKCHMLEGFLCWFNERCSNIKFTLSDKDLSEINAFCAQIRAKHQLCYWHGIRYVEERLAKDKPPAYYDSCKAHLVFGFIDATWAPGVTRGNIEEYFDRWDVEVGANVEGEVREHLQQMQNVSVHIEAAMCRRADIPLQTQIPSTLPPLVIIKAGDRCLPIWPEPPSRGEVDLPRYCPTELQ